MSSKFVGQSRVKNSEWCASSGSSPRTPAMTSSAEMPGPRSSHHSSGRSRCRPSSAVSVWCRSAAETTTSAGTSVPSASRTPRAVPDLRGCRTTGAASSISIAATSAPVRTSTPSLRAIRSSASITVYIPPRGKRTPSTRSRWLMSEYSAGTRYGDDPRNTAWYPSTCRSTGSVTVAATLSASVPVSRPARVPDCADDLRGQQPVRPREGRVQERVERRPVRLRRLLGVPPDRLAGTGLARLERRPVGLRVRRRRRRARTAALGSGTAGTPGPAARARRGPRSARPAARTRARTPRA